MTRSLQIPKGLSTEVRVVMTDGQEITGRFYLAENARNHPGRESLLDLLNDSGKAFLPFRQDERDDVVLVRQSRILGLQRVRDDDEAWSRSGSGDEGNWQAAEISLAGFSLTGSANTGDMPPQRQRLADLLNHEDPFIEFETDEGSWFINKNTLNLLVPLAWKGD
jgi:hypothetical protein